MKNKQKLLSFLTGISNLIYGGLVIASIFLAVGITFSPLLAKADLNITASVPVAIGQGDAPRFDVDVGGTAAKDINASVVDEAQGTLRLETSNWYLIFISNLAKLVYALGLTYAFYLLRAILKDISEDKIFTTENSQRIRRLGTTMLVLTFLLPSIEYTAASEVLRKLAIVQPALSAPDLFKAEVLFASLLIIIIGEVWAYGLELKREQELTV